MATTMTDFETRLARRRRGAGLTIAAIIATLAVQTFAIVAYAVTHSPWMLGAAGAGCLVGIGLSGVLLAFTGDPAPDVPMLDGEHKTPPPVSHIDDEIPY